VWGLRSSGPIASPGCERDPLVALPIWEGVDAGAGSRTHEDVLFSDLAWSLVMMAMRSSRLRRKPGMHA
jgi:hypothetical protein